MLAIEDAKALLRAHGYTVVRNEQVRRLSTRAEATELQLTDARAIDYVDSIHRVMFAGFTNELRKHVPVTQERLKYRDGFSYEAHIDIISPLTEH